MKKIIALFLVVMMLGVSIVACSPSNTSSTSSDGLETKDSTVVDPSKEADQKDYSKGFTIGYLGWNLGHAWNIGTFEGLQYGADMMNCEVIKMDAATDAQMQLVQAEELINRGVDCIALYPVSVESGATIVKLCNEAGIPVSVENSFLDDSVGEFVGQVACLYNEIGYAAVKWAAENIPDTKFLYVSGAYGQGVTEVYEIGVYEAIEEFGVELVDQLVIEHWTIEDAFNVTSSFIQGGGDFNVVFAQDDAIAKGVYQALGDAGLDCAVISTGGSSDGYLSLEVGETTANMTAPAHLQGLIQFGMLWAYMNGETWGEDRISLPVIPIDATNFDEWLKWDDMEGGYAYVSKAIGPYTPGLN